MRASARNLVREEPVLARRINLGQLISAISLAFDFAERAQLNHARRVAYLGLRLGERLGASEEELRRVLFAGMLHDLGATEHFAELAEDDVVPGTAAYDHPSCGASMVAGIPHLSGISRIIATHHERWAGGGYPAGLNGEQIPREARLLYLVDRFEVTFTARGWEEGLERVERGRGSEFEPALVEAFRSLTAVPRLRLDLAEQNIGRVIAWEVERLAQVLVVAELPRVAEVFAGIIDNRSPYTADHSAGVARIAGRVARRLGLDVMPIEVAALLHDLGKVGVPSRILNKPGKLTPEEYEVVKAHPYYTEHILRHVHGLGELVGWAAMHHERLDGTGYHSALPATEIPMESRLISVADVFQALTADRPYRPALTVEEALARIRVMAEAGHLDPEVVQALAETCV